MRLPSYQPFAPLARLWVWIHLEAGFLFFPPSVNPVRMQTCDCVEADGGQTPLCHHTCLACRVARRADEVRLRNWPLALVSLGHLNKLNLN